MLSDTFANLLHYGLVFRQAVFSIKTLLSLDSRGLLVGFRGRKS